MSGLKTIQAAGTPSALVDFLRDQLSASFKSVAPTVLDGLLKLFSFSSPPLQVALSSDPNFFNYAAMV